MTAKRLSRLRQIKAKRLTNGDKSVQKGARKAHVVVHDKQPVALRVAGRLDHPVQVLELATRQVLGHRHRPQGGVRRAGRAERDAHVVAV
jgi:hypothetical protein